MLNFQHSGAAMKPKRPEGLSRRERQIMDIAWRDGRVTAGEVLERMTKAPSYSAVRATLRILETKGHLRHEDDGTRYFYLPTLPRERARKSALRNLVDTFFEGSTEKVVAALLGHDELGKRDLERLSALIERARKEGR
jgi:BlaI family penicillinase repressor